MTTEEKRPWRMFLPLIVVVVLWILWSVWWAVVYYDAQRIYARELPRFAERGVEFACAQQSWGGYPFRVEMTCEKPTLKISRGRNLAASASRLAVIIQAYNLHHAIALIDGPTQVNGDRIEPVLAEHERAAISIRMASGDTFVVGAEVPKLSVNGQFTADRFIGNAMGGRDLEAVVSMQAEAPKLKLLGRVPVGIASAAAQAKIPVTLLAGGDVAALAASTGEKVTIENLQLIKGPLTVSATGMIGLDSARRLEGKLATKISDLSLLLEELKVTTGLKDSDAKAAGSMIAILNGGKTTGISADFVAKDGALFWGPFKIADLPPLEIAEPP